MEPTDQALLTRWRADDADAGSLLYQRHFAALYSFFRTKARAEDVGDLVQRTFLAVVESRDRLAENTDIRAYLYGVARKKLLHYWRGRRRDARLDFEASSLEDLDPRQSSLLAEKTSQRLLLEGLRSIPLDLQIVLELYFWESLTGPQLAAVLDIPEGTVRSRVRRGVEALRRELTRLGRSGEALRTTLDGLDQWAARVGQAGPGPS